MKRTKHLGEQLSGERDRELQWNERLRGFSMRVGFVLSLSKAMLEMLCAVADDVQWDRSLFKGTVAPDNFLAPTLALFKRGLIERCSEADIKKKSDGIQANIIGLYETAYYQLTPAGKAVVELLKMAGLFVEADAAINKKTKRA